jgi:hypothetical protein
VDPGVGFEETFNICLVVKSREIKLHVWNECQPFYIFESEVKTLCAALLLAGSAALLSAA